MKIKIVSEKYLDKLETATNAALEELKNYEILDVTVTTYKNEGQLGAFATIKYQ